MKIRILNSDNTVSSVSVQWHPEVNSQAGHKPAALWTTKSAVLSWYESVNAKRREYGVPERKIEKVIADIVGAEAPFEIYDDSEQAEPWRHFGLTLREVPYAMDADWWNKHA